MQTRLNPQFSHVFLSFLIDIQCCFFFPARTDAGKEQRRYPEQRGQSSAVSEPTEHFADGLLVGVHWQIAGIAVRHHQMRAT